MSQTDTDKRKAAKERTEEARSFIRRVRTATRRRYTAEEKIRIVLEGFRREVAVNDLCRREGIKPPLLLCMLWITRKGAIEATNGQWGVIPGSMGTKSYITKGLGNPASYNSSSHGAGRRMSRSQAKKNLTQESLNEAMKGKAWNQQPAALLDEHPAAYKDIDTVMDSQKDTTRIVHTLRQVVNYKGWN